MTSTTEEPDYDFSVFFGSVSDPIEIDTILTDYTQQTGIVINPILVSNNNNEVGTLQSLLNEDDPPAIYTVTSDMEMEWLTQGGFVADFSYLRDSTATHSVKLNDLYWKNRYPYTVNGYGLIFDHAVFREIFGKSKANKLINDLKAADHEQWSNFIVDLNEFINDRNTSGFVLGNHDYIFPGNRGALAQKLNGVFAIAGADSNMYGDKIMDQLMQTVDLSMWDAVKDETTDSALQVLAPTLDTYINGLDLMTSYLSGEFSSGIRGSDFINEDFYNTEKTNAMFMEGKAVFSIIDSHEYDDLMKINAKKAQTLEYLPIKLPYDDTVVGQATTEGAVLFSSIPAEVSDSLYINGHLSEDQQLKAWDFLNWFMSQSEWWDNHLRGSLLGYLEEGNVFKYGYTDEETEKWKENIFSGDGVEIFLKKGKWNEEYKENMRVFFAEMWSKS